MRPLEIAVVVLLSCEIGVVFQRITLTTQLT